MVVVTVWMHRLPDLFSNSVCDDGVCQWPITMPCSAGRGLTLGSGRLSIRLGFADLMLVDLYPACANATK